MAPESRLVCDNEKVRDGILYHLSRSQTYPLQFVNDIQRLPSTNRTVPALTLSSALLKRPSLMSSLTSAFVLTSAVSYSSSIPCKCTLAMASIVAASTVVAPAAFAAASSSVATSESSSVKAFCGLKSSTLFAAKAQTLSSVQNGSRVQCMQVWNPIGQTKFETFSYLPALTDEQISKQVEYMIQQKLIPCLEFDVNSAGVTRENNQSPGYYDGRYWTMWKLPMFGCNDSAQVLREIEECKKEYPACFVRVLGFDNVKQVQICGFLVARP